MDRIRKYWLEVSALSNEGSLTDTIWSSIRGERWLNTKPAMQYPSNLVVVLDLDECLIHTCGPDDGEQEFVNSQQNDDDDSSFICTFRGDQQRRILLRPGWKGFLETTLTRYETYIFTAGYSDYARPIISELERQVGKTFAGYRFRESCTETIYQAMVFTSKDIRQFRRDMSHIVLVDDDPTNFECSPDNAIPIQSFRGGSRNDSSNMALESVGALLQELEDLEDVRILLRERFKIKKLFEVAKEIYEPLPLQWQHVYKCAQHVQL